MGASNIDLEIGGRRYAVSCGKGEETRLRALGRAIDERVRASGAVGQSEPRMLLFAALMLADELADARDGVLPAAPDPARETAMAQRIDGMTARIENIARHLEGGDHHA